MNACEIYLYMSYIFAVKIVGLKKTEKKSQYAGSLPSATDGKEATWQATVLPGRLTILVSLPTVADGKEKKTLPTAADGKGLPMFAVSGR